MAKNPIDKLQKATEASQSVDQTHLNSVSELVALNRMAFERAKYIVDFGENGRLSPLIVLKEFSTSGGTMLVVGFMLIDSYKSSIATLQRVQASYYTIGKHQLEDLQEKYEEIDRDMSIDDDESPQFGMQEMMGRIDDARELHLGIGVSEEGEHLDEINLKTRTIIAKSFRFTRAILIGTKKRQFGKRIKDLNDTIQRFEHAVDDVNLNPQYADGMQKTLQAIQNLPEISE